MNTRQRVNTRSSFVTPKEGGKAGSTLTPSSGMKSEPLISQINPPSTNPSSTNPSLTNPPSTNPSAVTSSSSIPRGLMTRDGTPASSTTRLNSDLRINPLRSTPGSRPGTKTAQPVSTLTRGGAAKRTFKPKLPAISDTRRNDNVQTETAGQVLESVSKSDREKSDRDKSDWDRSRRSPSKRNGSIDTRSKKQIVQLESSVFTGSAGVLKPVRGTKASSSISFGLSSATGTVTSVSRVTSKSEDSKPKAKVSKDGHVSKDGYGSDDFIASDDESEESFGAKRNYSTMKPVGYDTLHSASIKRQGTKVIKQEKDQHAGTEFNESFLIRPASDVFMKFLSLQQVNHDKSMMMLQVPESLIKTEPLTKTEPFRNPEAECSTDSDPVSENYIGRDSDPVSENYIGRDPDPVSENYIGRLRIYQSGRVEILKQDGSVYGIMRTGNEIISVPCDLPKIIFRTTSGDSREYVMQSNAATSTVQCGRDCPKYQVVRMDLKYQTRESASSDSPLKEAIGGSLTEIAQIDPKEDLIATPIISEGGVISDVISTDDVCDESVSAMECDS